MVRFAILEGRDESVCDTIFDGKGNIRKAVPSGNFSLCKADVILITEKALQHIKGNAEMFCGTIIIPGDRYIAGNIKINSKCLITYGFSPKNSITLSSINEDFNIVTLQREVITARGKVMEQQEIPVHGYKNLDSMQILAATSAMLILDML